MENLFETNRDLLLSTLLDEGKLITYVSISKDLCVHVNISKLILQRLAEYVRQKSSNTQLNVCYVISGATDKNKARTIICTEQDLTKEKKNFKNIFFEHIYSIIKGNHSIDTAAYLTVNKFEDFALCSGLIKSKQCDKRTLNEIGDLKSNSQVTNTYEKTNTLPVSSKKIKQEANITKNGHNEIKTSSRRDLDSKPEPVIKQEVVSPNKETPVPISAGMGNNKPKASSNNGHKTQKGIAGFFNKNNSINKQEIKEKIVNGNATTQGRDTDTVEVPCDKMEVEEVEKPTNTVQKGNNSKILSEIKKTSKVDKKRKRVLHVSDSESDNENNDPFIDESIEERAKINHDSEDEIPPTPTVTNIVIKSGIVNPKKRRKVIDKTYTDDDGYILTKKVEVYESCSDNEGEAEVQEKPQAKEVKIEVTPKQKTTSSKKKVSPPQKGKQSMLTNFFKKL